MKRYREIIDQWEEFQEACEKPIVKTVRKNRIKAGKNFEEKLREEFDSVEQSSWNDEVYRLATDSPGKSLMHWRGEYYVQEESATLPVKVLEPERGEKILDMCAAPGGKTTQIASKLENRGFIVANDQSSSRIQGMTANKYRMGAASISTANYDGRNLPEDEKYDRVLVDAPCSGEGDKARRNFKSASMDEIEGLAELQKKLLEKAEKLVKENGVIVYSTCTFAPEENEEVVLHALEETGLELERIETEAPHSKGVKEFQDREYGREMRKTVRIYPHHLDSGGIYVARFRK